MIFPIAMRFRDGKTRRARGGGRFASSSFEFFAPFDTLYTLAQGSHACGQRDARYRHRRNAIANRVFLTPALRHRALPNRSCGRLGPWQCRAGGRRVWSEGVVGQKRSKSVCTVVTHVVVKGKHWFARPTTRTTRRASHREK